MLTHVSCFAGIGMLDLAAEHAGFMTTVMVEKDEFCRRVLAKRFPSATILDDIEDVTGAQLLRLTEEARGGGASGISPTIDLFSGGFP